jgi:hypothetical protein
VTETFVPMTEFEEVVVVGNFEDGISLDAMNPVGPKIYLLTFV